VMLTLSRGLSGMMRAHHKACRLGDGPVYTVSGQDEGLGPSPFENAGEMLNALPEIYFRDSKMAWCLDVPPALHRKTVH